MFADTFQSLDMWTANDGYISSLIGLPDRLPNKISSQNVYTDDAGLHIKAERVGDEYVSGGLDTHGKQSWQYGYFECKIRWPDVPGIWGGFFSVNADTWPPEIDAGEVFNNSGRVRATVHKDANISFYLSKDFGLGFIGAWHTIGFLWTENEIIWVIDGKEYYRCAGYVPDMPMTLHINLGMGEFQAPDDSQLPTTLDVEYVRVWQRPA